MQERHDRQPGHLSRLAEIAAELFPVNKRAKQPDLINGTEAAVALNPTDLSAKWPNPSSDFCARGRTSVDHRSGLRAVTDAELGAERFDGVKGGEMMPNKSLEAGGRVGDWIEPHGVHGQASRRGEIIEVLGREGHEHYRVRWDEQHESIVYPADGVIVTPGPGRRGRGAGKRRAR